MVYLELLLSAASGLLSLALLRRLHRTRSALHRLTPACDRPSRLLGLLRRELDDLIDRELLVDNGPGGLAEIALRFREPHDACDNVADLLDEIVRTAETRSHPGLVNLTKSLYQLQYTLGIPVPGFGVCIQDVADRFLSGGHPGPEVRRVGIVREGEPVDPVSMWPLSHGTRVRQPFGVVLFDEAGRVLSKAKVLCY